MRILIRLAAGLGALLSAAWLIYRPAFDSSTAFAGALVLFLSTFVGTPRASSRPTQSQTVSEGAVGIQAGRDANVSGPTQGGS